MSNSPKVAEALEGVYASLAEDNKDIDLHIKTLKSAMTEEGQKEVAVAPERLAHNNRAGRKMMQSYFKKRGVKISFTGE